MSVLVRLSDRYGSVKNVTKFSNPMNSMSNSDQRVRLK